MNGIKKWLKKIGGYVVAFVSGVLAVILTVLYHNRRRIDNVGTNFDHTTDRLDEAEDIVERATTANKTAREILQKVRERKQDL